MSGRPHTRYVITPFTRQVEIIAYTRRGGYRLIVDGGVFFPAKRPLFHASGGAAVFPHSPAVAAIIIMPTRVVFTAAVYRDDAYYWRLFDPIASWFRTLEYDLSGTDLSTTTTKNQPARVLPLMTSTSSRILVVTMATMWVV